MSSYRSGWGETEACFVTGVKSVRGSTASLFNRKYSSKILKRAKSRRCGRRKKEKCEGPPKEQTELGNLKKKSTKTMKMKLKKKKKRRSNEVTAAHLPSTRSSDPIEYQSINNQPF